MVDQGAEFSVPRPRLDGEVDGEAASRSRPDIRGPAEPAALPERLAMREQQLASDLELLRQWKSIVETFYVGLSEEQRRGADQLLTQLFGF